MSGTGVTSTTPGTTTSIGMLRERCRTMGLPTWRCDNAGVILDEPRESGPAGLLLGTGVFARMVSNAAKEWGISAASGGMAGVDSSCPDVLELFPGCWAIPLPEKRRAARIGCTVAVAFSPASLNEEMFLAACRAAQLDAQATRKSMLWRARYDSNSSRAARDMLLWMAHDLERLEQSDHTVAGFTRQLTDCFETIDLLYSLGRSMNDLAQPEQFIRHMCDRLRGTLPFAWVGAWFSPDDRLGPSISGRLFCAGECPVEGSALGAAHDALMPSRAGGKSGPQILTELNGVPLPGAGQILMHTVQRGGGSGQSVGLIFAGDKYGDDPQVSSYDIQLLEAAAGYVGAFLDNAVLYADQQALFLGTLEALTASIDAKDRYTFGHSQRVAHLSSQLAIAAGLSAAEAERIRIAGLVHDVGKIGVPEAVLCKVGRLTDPEFTAIKLHPEIGYRILKDIRLLADVLPGVLHHHERWDGKGYPHGVVGKNIPQIARIIALADTFDAMSSTRSYRAAMERPVVLAEIARCAGAQFDAALAAVFVTLDFAEYDRMVAMHAANAAQGSTPPAAPSDH